MEKKYLEYITKLLIMVQTHCEIKTDMYKKFKESGALKEEKKENWFIESLLVLLKSKTKYTLICFLLRF